MGWLILIGIIAFVIWLESKDDDDKTKSNVAGAITSIAIGYAAGKALNKSITGGAPKGVGDDYKPGGKYYKGED